MKLGFSWVGIVVFALPMIINVFYVVFPPNSSPQKSTGGIKPLEIIEQVTRIAYLALLVFFVSERQLSPKSIWLYAAAVFLVLYYVVWIRYFAGGRDVALLKKPFCFIPFPLAVFPVLYFIFAAIWMGNIFAAAVMIVFGAAHISITAKSF